MHPEFVEQLRRLMGAGHAAELDHLDAAALCGAHRVMLAHIVKAVEPFVGTNRAGRGRRDLRHRLHVVPHHGLLEEIERLARGSGVLERLFTRPALVAIGRQLDPAVHCLADRERAFDVLLDRLAAHLDLHVGHTGRGPFSRLGHVHVDVARGQHRKHRHLGPANTPEQLRHGLLLRLAREVVAGHLDHRLGAGVSVHAPVHLREILRECRGIAALHKGREELDRGDDALDGLAGHRRRRRRLAPAHEAVIRLDAREHILRYGDFHAGHLERPDERQVGSNRFDFRDLHLSSPFRVSRAARCYRPRFSSRVLGFVPGAYSETSSSRNFESLRRRSDDCLRTRSTSQPSQS